MKIIEKSCIELYLLSFTLEVIQTQSLLVNSLKRPKNSLQKIEKFRYESEKLLKMDITVLISDS